MVEPTEVARLDLPNCDLGSELAACPGESSLREEAMDPAVTLTFSMLSGWGWSLQRFLPSWLGVPHAGFSGCMAACHQIHREGSVGGVAGLAGWSV
jgi:hypothetical protein